MPIDIAQLKPPKQYPSRGLGLRTWLVVCLLCVLLVDGAILLLWPQGTLAQGAWFWLLMAGLPTVVIISLVAWNRLIYENQHLHALYYNDHRERRRLELVRDGQRSVTMLGYAYWFPAPMSDGELANTIVQAASLVKAQPLRDGTTIVRHLRFPDDINGDSADARLAAIMTRPSFTREGKLYAQLLAPMIDEIEAFIKEGAPPVLQLVVAENVRGDCALEQMRVALDGFHLSALTCQTVSAEDGLMQIDTWLDSKEPRLLLVVAVSLHDTPPAESAECGVAMLLAPESLRLPKSVKARARIHRPAARPNRELGQDIALSMLWGKTTPTAVCHTWVTGFADAPQTMISDACRRSGLEHLTAHASRFHLDSTIGDTGPAAGWLAIVAAAEFAAGSPQLILNRARTAQALVVYAPLPQS